jgi:histidinol-phosphate/aromatic aminotransferase/cobyric acid decarboxylase-like protein
VRLTVGSDEDTQTLIGALRDVVETTLSRNSGSMVG